MYEYTIYVTFKGTIYQTNVIANKKQSEEEVYQIAKEQVLKQWVN
ncbi:MAG: BA3454 family stress response protein [Bacillota bacterium]